MITSETPYKLDEIIRDTWPQLYRSTKSRYINTAIINKFQIQLDDMNNFTVYTKIGCPFCTKVTSVLELAELQYVEYKLGRDFNREEFYIKFGNGATFPQVVVNDTRIGGCQETVKYLKENNLV